MPEGESRIVLPKTPTAIAGRVVRAWSEPVVIDTRVLVLRAQLALLDGDLERAAILAQDALVCDPLNPAVRTVAERVAR
ncbi:MAG TPA: hypothetical protein VHG10_06350 [Glycomyces sp.]|nr:hypothetical protein [Glycomyces sp.]